MTHRIKASLLAVAVLATGIAVGGEAAFAYQGHMFNAQSDLQAAQHQLSVAIPDKAGHRDNAIALVNQAIAQVNQGIAAGRR